MMKTVLVTWGTLTATLVAFGSTTNVSSVAELGNSVTVGNDTLRYTGTGAETYTGTFTASPGDKATTVDIANKGGALTFADFTQSSGGFVKTGPGSLTMKTGGFTLTRGVDANYWGGTAPLVWTDGSCADHYSPLVVHEGTLKFDFPTKETTDTAPDSVVGHVSGSTPTPSARLEILRGTLDMGNSITIDRGAGHTADHPLQSVYVGANGVLKGANIWMTSQHTTSDYYGNSLLDVDGGTVEVSTDVQFGRSTGEAKILVRNGGVFSENAAVKQTVNRGMYLPYSSSSSLSNVFEVTGASTGRFHLATCFGSTVRKGERMKIKVTDGGTILNDAYHPMALTNNWGGGVAEFDGGKIAGWYVRSACEWFPFLEAYTVGAGGLTLCAETIGALGGAARGTGEITLTGGGTIGLHPGQADITVGTGGLRLTAPLIPTLVADLAKTGTITSAAGGTVEMVGADALGKMTLVAGSQTNTFKAYGLEADALQPGASAGWTYCGVAVPRSDGWFHFARVNAGDVGNVWRKTKVDLTKSFRLSFDYFITHQSFAAGSYRPYGLSVIFQNTTQGLTKIGNGGRAMGFGADGSKWTNSFAFGYDSADSSMRYSRHDDGGGDYFLTADGTKDKGLSLVPRGATEPMRGIVTYDAASHLATFTMQNFSGTSSGTISNIVNLAERCGASTAYLGFGAPGTLDSKGTGEHFVGNVQFFLDGETPSETVDVGGTVRIAADKTFKAKLDTGSRAKTWSVGQLDWADGATVEVEGDADAALGFSAFSGSGSLTKTGSGLLGVCSPYGPFRGTLDVRKGGLRFGNPLAFAQTEANWMLNEKGIRLGGGFVTDGFQIGRAQNAANSTDHYVGMMNSMGRMAVDRSFTITYDLKIDVDDVRGPYGYYSLCFHNDPRGAAAIGEPNVSNSSRATCVQIEKCAGLIWGGGKDPSNSSGSAPHENQVTTVVGSNQTGGSNWTSTRPVTMVWGFNSNTTYETNGTVKVVYDASAKTLYLKMTQRAGNDTNVFEHTFENFDIAAAVGDNMAYLGFGANTAQKWFGIRQTVKNLSITYPDGEYVDGTIALKGAQTDLVLDAATAGTLNLAKALTAPAGATVRLVNADAAVAARVGAITCDGVLTVDGGILAIDQNTLANVKKLNLVNGAKLQVAPGVKVMLARVYLDGVPVGGGTYTDGFVTGGGAVSVCPPGTTIIFR